MPNVTSGMPNVTSGLPLPILQVLNTLRNKPGSQTHASNTSHFWMWDSWNSFSLGQCVQGYQSPKLWAVLNFHFLL